jgi:lysophospholipase L1-like esterase
LLSVLAVLVVGEMGVRAYHYLRFDVPVGDGHPSRRQTSSRLSPIELDEELGWRPTANYRFAGLKRNSDGTQYPAQISQDANGFRLYGKLSSGRPRLLVIGDSFTQAVEASDDRTYYAVIRDLLDIEVFAYGGGGYGTLQELMILDRYFSVIKPDLILWQFSTNDLVNNSPVLEAASTINNNGLIRPYWVNGRVQYILPSKDAAGIRRFAINYCRLCYLLLHRVDRLQAAMNRSTIETDTSAGESQHPIFLRARQTTDELIGQLRARTGQVPIAALIIDAGQRMGPEYRQALIEIAEHYDLMLLGDVADTVARKADGGTVVTAEDGVHWNETGHQIAGQAIAAHLETLPQLRGQSQ